MLQSMQEQTTEDAVVERDPREELLDKAREKFSAGDFVAVGKWLDETIDEAAEETAVLKPVRNYLKLDPGALVVAVTSGLAILLIAVLTLFH
jgi:hypothetical protein